MKRWTDKWVMAVLAVAFAAGALHYGVGFARTWRTRGALPIGNLEPLVIFHVADPEGNPVAGARVCNQVGVGQDGGEAFRWMGHVPTDAFSDAEGMVRIPARPLFNLDGPQAPLAFYVAKPDRGLAGVLRVTQSDVDRVLQLTVEPACRVDFNVASSDLAASHRQLTGGFYYVSWTSAQTMPLAQGLLRGTSLLPPGHYALQAYGTPFVYPANADLEITPGETQRVVTVDLTAKQVARLFGKPAPPLEGIRAWRNTEPLQLADLRGKVVVLQLWTMTNSRLAAGTFASLARLQQLYGDEGLAVLTVHDGSPETVEQFDRTFGFLRGVLDGGVADIIPIALDSHETFRVDDQYEVTGRTTATYGGPQTLLIDREGRVARTLSLFNGRSLHRAIRAALAGEDPGADDPEERPRTWDEIGMHYDAQGRF